MASRARTPPMPRTISWRIRISGSPAGGGVGEVPFGGFVLRDVGIEEKQRHAPDLGAPDVRDGRLAELGNRHLQRCAGIAAPQRQWQVVEVVVLVRLLLPAGFVEILAEVSLLVEQTDADQRQPEI